MTKIKLALYADTKCSEPIEAISWDNAIKLKLADGRDIVVANIVEPGQEASASVYLKNEEAYTIAIKDIEFEDKRLRFDIENAYLKPGESTQLTIRFKAPKKVSRDSIVEEGKVTVKAVMLYGGQRA